MIASNSDVSSITRGLALTMVGAVMLAGAIGFAVWVIARALEHLHALDAALGS